MHPDTYLTTGEAALLCHLGVSTVRRYADAGYIVVETLPTGHRRIRVRDLVRFMLAHQMAVPFELDAETC